MTLAILILLVLNTLLILLSIMAISVVGNELRSLLAFLFTVKNQPEEANDVPNTDTDKGDR